MTQVKRYRNTKEIIIQHGPVAGIEQTVYAEVSMSISNMRKAQDSVTLVTQFLYTCQEVVGDLSPLKHFNNQAAQRASNTPEQMKKKPTLDFLKY